MSTHPSSKAGRHSQPYGMHGTLQGKPGVSLCHIERWQRGCQVMLLQGCVSEFFDPFAFQCLTSRKTCLGIDSQQVGNESFRRNAHILPLSIMQCIIATVYIRRNKTLIFLVLPSPAKGAYPPIIMNKMHPKLHMSTAVL
jgi:hypothetical protein